MKRYSFFAGCKIPYFLSGYGASSLALLRRFEIDPLEIEFNCCGYPVRDIDLQAYILAGTKNLALAEQQNTDIVTPCKCCYGSLKYIEHYLLQHPRVHAQTNEILQGDGLKWEGRARVYHLLSALAQEVGPDVLGNAVGRPFRDLRVAVHPGCHALRPANVTQFDDPLAPQLLDRLVALTGATPVFWSMSSDCCGSPQAEKNQNLARRQTRRKMRSAARAGADCICTACTYCQLQFARNSTIETDSRPNQGQLPAIPVTQLLGLSMGLDPEVLGLDADTHDRLLEDYSK